jgi:hypothetical protein
MIERRAVLMERKAGSSTSLGMTKFAKGQKLRAKSLRPKS